MRRTPTLGVIYVTEFNTNKTKVTRTRSRERTAEAVWRESVHLTFSTDHSKPLVESKKVHPFKPVRQRFSSAKLKVQNAAT